MPFTQQFLEEQRQILGEPDYNQEYLGIPGGGNASPFTWDQYERATGVHAPLVPPGPAFARVPDDPAHWPIKYPVITHDVGRTNDRSTAVVGGYSPLVPDELVVKEIVELPLGYFGHQLASALMKVDARYDHNAVIVPDLSNDVSYAEVLCDAFGKRVRRRPHRRRRRWHHDRHPHSQERLCAGLSRLAVVSCLTSCCKNSAPVRSA